jgi:hypothetical protein
MIVESGCGASLGAFHHCPCMLSWLSQSQADAGWGWERLAIFPVCGRLSFHLHVLRAQFLTALSGLTARVGVCSFLCVCLCPY